MISSSTGSTTCPFSSLVTMSGRETCSSKPSRRIISIRIDSCSSPRPITLICSGVSVGSMRIETLPSSSLSNRSLSCREVTYWPSRPAIGEVLTPKIMRHRGFVDRDRRNRDLVLHVGDRLADRDVLDSGQTDDVAGGGFLDVDPLEAVERIELGDLGVLDRGVELDHRHGIADLDPAVEDAPDRDAADVVARIQVRDQQLQRRVGVAARRRHVLDDRVEQRPQVFARRFRIEARRADPGVGVQHRKIELILAGVEIDEQVVDLVQHFRDPRVGPVDLVDHHDRRQPALERLAQHEAGLRQRPFRRVDQQHHSVDHRQRPFDLTAEIRVAGSVDDVDQHVVVVHGGVLGENGDPALALQLVAVHRALGDPLVGAEGAALVQQRIDQGRLAVVDVGDDGDVATERVGDIRLTGM